jgi:hypothetical protein
LQYIDKWSLWLDVKILVKTIPAVIRGSGAHEDRAEGKSALASVSLAFKRFRHKVARTGLRRPLSWLRNQGLDAADVFPASCPTSGSTWTRPILYQILAGESSSFGNVSCGIPENGVQWLARPRFPDEARLIKTHEPYRREYGRPVYLVGCPVQFVSAGIRPVIVTTTPNPSSARRGAPLLDKEGPGVAVTKWLRQPTGAGYA